MITVQKIGETVANLAPREGQRGFLVDGLGSDWTEARLGIFFSVVDAHDDNVSGPDEVVDVDAYNDYTTFGLKNSSNRNLPGEASSYFIGIRSSSPVSKLVAPSSSAGWFADENQQCIAMAYNGVSIISGGVVPGSSFRFPNPNPETGFNGFYCIKLVVSGRGTSSQSVAISVARSESVSGSDYSKAKLYQMMNNSAFGPSTAVAWNTGVAARTLPDVAWVRLPFFNNRLRLHQIMSIKSLP